MKKLFLILSLFCFGCNSSNSNSNPKGTTYRTYVRYVKDNAKINYIAVEFTRSNYILQSVDELDNFILSLKDIVSELEKTKETMQNRPVEVEQNGRN